MQISFITLSEVIQIFDNENIYKQLVDGKSKAKNNLILFKEFLIEFE